MPEEMVIFTRTYDFISWLLPITQNFPRNQRFVVTTRLQTAALNFQELLIEANAERGADQGHPLGAALQRGDIGDVRLGGGDGRSGNPRANPRDEQPRQALLLCCQSKQRVKHDRPCQANDQYRPSADTVRQSPPQRSEQELHGRKAGHQPAQ